MLHHVFTAGESQACAAAAKERIEVLEQEAEQAATEQQAAADAAAQALEDAKSVAATELQAAQDAVAAELQQAQEQQETERRKLQAELEAVKVCCQHTGCHSVCVCVCVYVCVCVCVSVVPEALARCSLTVWCALCLGPARIQPCHD
jgi:hypothetical protein